MFKVIGVILFLIILVVGVEFSAVNSDAVTVNYILGTGIWPLSFVVVCAFSLGMLIAAVISLGIVLPLRWRLARLQRTVSGQEQELGALLKKSDRGARGV